MTQKKQQAAPPDFLVAGGANVDIGGYAFGNLKTGDSNPGRIRISFGGVGRNIAHNLRLLGLPVKLLTAYGDDLYGQRLISSCRELGIDLSQALCLPGENTSAYLYLADSQGEMAMAVSDMDICNRLTPAYLEEKLPVLNSARAVVADTNLPAASLEYLAKNCERPLFVDPVSTAKAEKLLPILNRIHTLKPNALEAALLAGVPVETEQDGERAVEILLEKGVQRIFLTMGAKGVLAAEAGKKLWLPNYPGKMVSATGCGDSFLAALVWAWEKGLNLESSARAGLAAGAITLESPQTIHPGMNEEALIRRAGFSL